jgi:anaerobic selenocysteine-containing dehydrogenase
VTEEPTAHFRTCPLCEATCGLRIDVAGGEVTRIRGDRDDVFSRGFLCPKGSSLKGLHDDPDRIRTPLVQVDGRFEPASWEDAFALIDERLRPIVVEHGKDAVALYSGNPWSHNYETIIYTPLLYGAVGRNRFAAASVDQRPREIVSSVHFGTRTAFPVPDLDRTHLLVLLGSDPLESNGSLATAPDWPGRLDAIRARGGSVIVVDPRRSKTAAVADEHLPIVPGTDAALLAGIAHVLFTDGLADPGPLADHVDGLDTVAAALAPFSPDVVGSWCGIAPERIRRLAHQLAEAPSAAVHGRLGTCLADLATLSSWLLDVVNLATGNLDRPGGVMFSRPAAFGLNTAGRPGIGAGTDYATFHSRVRGLPGAFGQLPAVCLAEEIETPGDGQVRGLVTIAGNPVLSVPDSDRLATALDTLEFMVSVDLYLNETTRHADVILPAPSPLERSHYDVAYYQFSIRNIANYSPPVLPIRSGQPKEWQILLALTGILQGRGAGVDVGQMDADLASLLVQLAVADEHSPIHGRDAAEIMAALGPRTGPERLLDLQLRAGPYGDGFGTREDGLSLDRLLDHPHGIDLGPLEPRIPEMLRTPTGRIDLATPAFVADLDRLRHRLESPRPPLVLIGRRHLRSNNSWQHNIHTLAKGRERCVLQIHPDDAARRGLATGSRATITSAVGSIEAPVEVTDTVMAGVVSMPHGWGHDLDGTRLNVARRRPGANINRLASNDDVDPLSGNPVLNGVPVEVEAAPHDPTHETEQTEDDES